MINYSSPKNRIINRTGLPNIYNSNQKNERSKFQFPSSEADLTLATKIEKEYQMLKQSRMPLAERLIEKISLQKLPKLEQNFSLRQNQQKKLSYFMLPKQNKNEEEIIQSQKRTNKRVSTFQPFQRLFNLEDSINKQNTPNPEILKLLQGSLKNNPTTDIHPFNEVKTNPQTGIIQFTVKTRPGCTNNKKLKINQDSTLQNPKNLQNAGINFFSVCDGHGQYGHLVSQYICKNIPQLIESNLFGVDLTQLVVTTKGCTDAFLTLNKALCEADFDTNLSGSTNCSVILWKDYIYSVNVGDSRAILCQCEDDNWKLVELTHDHKPELDNEKLRIINQGGRVETQMDLKGNQIGPYRVWLKDQDIPGLAMSRSFGDKVGAQAGIITEPEVQQFQRSVNDKFLIIASDGVFEYLTNEQVSNIIKPFYQKRQIEQASKKLIVESSLAWKKNSFVRDDITCIVIFFY